MACRRNTSSNKFAGQQCPAWGQKRASWWTCGFIKRPFLCLQERVVSIAIYFRSFESKSVSNTDRALSRLYLITPPRIDDLSAFAKTLEAVIKAGDVACFQLRLKDVSNDYVVEAAKVLFPIAQSLDVACLINDHPDLAKLTGADGVHIGQSDGSFADARAVVGKNAIIGVTCHDSRHLAMDAAEAGADYVAFGAFFDTTTKTPLYTATPDLLTWWQEMMEIPCVAIGGITPNNGEALIRAGADFLAVSAGVWHWPKGPEAASAAFAEMAARCV
jgi:thiamine-phosphate pyrophosphorylase